MRLILYILLPLIGSMGSKSFAVGPVTKFDNASEILSEQDYGEMELHDLSFGSLLKTLDENDSWKTITIQLKNDHLISQSQYGKKVISFIKKHFSNIPLRSVFLNSNSYFYNEQVCKKVAESLIDFSEFKLIEPSKFYSTAMKFDSANPLDVNFGDGVSISKIRKEINGEEILLKLNALYKVAGLQEISYDHVERSVHDSLNFYDNASKNIFLFFLAENDKNSSGKFFIHQEGGCDDYLAMGRPFLCDYDGKVREIDHKNYSKNPLVAGGNYSSSFRGVSNRQTQGASLGKIYFQRDNLYYQFDFGMQTWVSYKKMKSILMSKSQGSMHDYLVPFGLLEKADKNVGNNIGLERLSEFDFSKIGFPIPILHIKRISIVDGQSIDPWQKLQNCRYLMGDFEVKNVLMSGRVDLVQK